MQLSLNVSLSYLFLLDYNMEEVDPSEMLSLTKTNKKVSQGDSIHVVCNSSSYYFASGTKFGVKYKGSDDLIYIKGKQSI